MLKSNGNWTHDISFYLRSKRGPRDNHSEFLYTLSVLRRPVSSVDPWFEIPSPLLRCTPLPSVIPIDKTFRLTQTQLVPLPLPVNTIPLTRPVILSLDWISTTRLGRDSWFPFRWKKLKTKRGRFLGVPLPHRSTVNRHASVSYVWHGHHNFGPRDRCRVRFWTLHFVKVNYFSGSSTQVRALSVSWNGQRVRLKHDDWDPVEKVQPVLLGPILVFTSSSLDGGGNFFRCRLITYKTTVRVFQNKQTN